MRWRQWLLELELSIESMAEALRDLAKSTIIDHELRSAVVRSLCAARQALNEGGPNTEPGLFEQLANQVSSAGEKTERSSSRSAVEHFAEALHDFAIVQNPPESEQAGSPFARRTARLEGRGDGWPTRCLDRPSLGQKKRQPVPAQPAEHGRDEQQKTRPIVVRRALQATVAGAIAIAAGEAVSPQRWYWAAIAAFVVFARTSSSGDTLVKAIQRVLGTLIGIAVGLGMAQAVRGHRPVETVLVFVCIFFAYLLIRISYFWMVIWFTLLLSALYSLLGQLTPGLLELRLWLTLLGAAAGVLALQLSSRCAPATKSGKPLSN